MRSLCSTRKESLAAFINKRSDNLENMISRISDSVEALKTSIHFVFKEIDTLKLQTEAVKLNVRVPTKGCPTSRRDLIKQKDISADGT